MSILFVPGGNSWRLSRGLSVWGEAPSQVEDYFASWMQQNYIWQPESYPPWWG
jgi:hypothetical protein